MFVCVFAFVISGERIPGNLEDVFLFFHFILALLLLYVCSSFFFFIDFILALYVCCVLFPSLFYHIYLFCVHYRVS